MEDNLRNLSNHLGEASSIINSLLVTSMQATSQPSPAPPALAAVTNSVVNRARSMLSTSMARGSFTRLNQRERLRAGTSTRTTCASQVPLKKKKENEEKSFEFVLVNLMDEEVNKVHLDTPSKSATFFQENPIKPSKILDHFT